MKVKDLIKALQDSSVNENDEIRVTYDGLLYHTVDAAYRNEWHDGENEANMVFIIEVDPQDKC